jgi:hypothetical protein
MRNIILIIAFLAAATNIFAKNTEFETATFRMALDEKGHVVSLFDKVNNKEYLASSQAAPLLSIRCNGSVEAPSQMKVRGNTLTLQYSENKVSIQIDALVKPGYISFELASVSQPDKVELVIWGPYPTTISETIGESVGVVRNPDFAIGIQALNIKTLGGYPTEENDIEPSYNIFASESYVDIEGDWRSRKNYRGQTARVQDFGSILQAYTRNRSKERIISNWGHTHYVAPAFNDGGVKGSKIALFGCPAAKALETIGQIEIAEGLPHPLINGEWAKTAREATASYLIIGFTEANLDQALELTKKAGLKYLYHGHPFKSWGHFPLIEQAFPDNWVSMKRCVDRARAQGVYLGVHTLSNFINTNDPYVTPIPDQRLAKVGESVLTRDTDDQTDEIFIESPLFFNQMQNNSLQSVLIGNEIIRYREVSDSEPWRLLGCVRGSFGTTASAHTKGSKIGKLMDHGYKVFLSDADLSEEIAVTLARLFNETGLMQISFDGLEGVWSTGKGQYARSLFTKNWYDNLNPELKGRVINDASNPGHYNWHINTRYNWGEPWYAGFRESQTQYRLMNQDFYRRNLLPSMLGWFSMNAQTSIEDTEWLLARAAGFDAGFAFNLNLNHAARNGASDAIFKAINTWETARMAGAFTPQQKLRMEDINNEFHLEAAGEGKWNLFQYQIHRFVHEQKIRQPGEPVHSIFEFDNPFHEQPLMFIMDLKPGENESGATISQITIEVNNYSRLVIPVKMEQTHVLKLDGKGSIQMFDKSWNLLETISPGLKMPLLSKGKNKIIVDAEFVTDGFSKLNIEMKTISQPEAVKVQNN